MIKTINGDSVIIRDDTDLDVLLKVLIEPYWYRYRVEELFKHIKNSNEIGYMYIHVMGWDYEAAASRRGTIYDVGELIYTDFIRF